MSFNSLSRPVGQFGLVAARGYALGTMNPALFEVRESGCKGQGGFATRDIQAGERILAEHPLVKWRRESEMSEAATESDLGALIDGISPGERRQFFELSQAALHGDSKSALGIWASNAYPTDSGQEAGVCSAVFVLACRLNHECRPNAHVYWNDNIRRLTVHALRAIGGGEEITVAYLGGDADGTRAARQRQLEAKFGFVCTCPQCTLVGAPLDESEVRGRR